MDVKSNALVGGAGEAGELLSDHEAGGEREEPVPILEEVGFSRGRFRFYALFIFFGFLGLFCYLITSGDDDLTQQRAWACVIMFLGFVPSILFCWSGKIGRIPLLPLLAFYHAMAFGFGGFYSGIFSLSPQRLLPAQEGAALGLLGLLVGYYLVGSRLFANVKSFRLKFRPSIEDVMPYTWYFLVLVETLNNVPKPWPIIGFLQQSVPAFSWLALIVIFLNFLRDLNWRKPANFIFLFFVLPFEYLLRMSSGAIGQVMALTMTLSIVNLNYRKTIPYGVIGGLLLFAFIMQPIKAQFRDIIWSPSGAHMSIIEKGELLWELYLKNYGHPSTIKSKENPLAVERLSQLGILAVVINKTPSEVPFRYGVTYLPLISKWIPRIVWDGKPTENQGNQFGHWYGFIGPDDFNTSVNLPWLVELFLNFGWGGLFWGMLTLGVIMYYFSVKFCNEGQNLLEYGLCLSMVFQIWWAESNVSLMWGGALISAMTYVVFFWILKQMRVRLVEPTE